MGTEIALQVLEKKSQLAGRLIGRSHELAPGTGALIALKHLKTPRATGRNYWPGETKVTLNSTRECKDHWTRRLNPGSSPRLSHQLTAALEQGPASPDLGKQYRRQGGAARPPGQEPRCGPVC